MFADNAVGLSSDDKFWKMTPFATGTLENKENLFCFPYWECLATPLLTQLIG